MPLMILDTVFFGLLAGRTVSVPGFGLWGDTFVAITTEIDREGGRRV